MKCSSCGCHIETADALEILAEVLRRQKPYEGQQLDTKQAAYALGCSEEKARRLAATKQIAATRIGRSYMFDPQSLESYRKRSISR